MDAQWFEHLRASATAMEPSHGMGLTTGQPMGPRELCRWCRPSSNVPARCRTTFAGNVSTGTSLNGATPR